jgi:hypothetical protein
MSHHLIFVNGHWALPSYTDYGIKDVGQWKGCRNPGIWPPILICSPRTSDSSNNQPKSIPINTAQSKDRVVFINRGGLFGLGSGVGPGTRIFNRNGFVTRSRRGNPVYTANYFFGPPITRYG